MQSELAETKSQLESERDALQAELSSVSSSRDAELSALRAELEDCLLYTSDAADE